MHQKVTITDDVTSDTPTHEQSSMTNQRTAVFWRLILVGGLLFFIAMLTIALRREWVSEQRTTGLAPDFEITTFAGEPVRLADLCGKGVVLNFWASWCIPCRTQAPMLEQAWRRERERGIVFIGLAYLDQEHAAQAFLDEFDITYPNGPDLQSAAARRYRITGVPETFFIDPDGNIASIVIGPIISPSDLNQRLDAIRPSQ